MHTNRETYTHEIQDETCDYIIVTCLCLRYCEHISCFMYRQSKRAGIIDFVRPPMNLRSNKEVKFKKETKYRYTMHLNSPRVRGVKVWDMLPETVQKATTKVKFKLLIKRICRTV